MVSPDTHLVLPVSRELKTASTVYRTALAGALEGGEDEGPRRAYRAGHSTGNSELGAAARMRIPQVEAEGGGLSRASQTCYLQSESELPLSLR